MKTNKLIAASLIFTIILTSTAFGQRARNFSRFSDEARREFRDCNLDLTSEQKDKMAGLREARLEANKERRESLANLRKQRQELMAGKDTDVKKVNEIIDQMHSLRATIEKENLKHRQEFRALLSDEQLARFENRERHARRFEARREFRPRAKFRK